MRKVLAGVLALMLFVPIASAGPGSGPIDIDIAKKEGGPWLEGGYIHVKVGQQNKSIFWRAQNREDVTLEVIATDILNGPGEDDYKVKWFRGDKNVTDDFQGDGDEFKIKAGKKVIIEAIMKAEGADPDPVCITPQFDHNLRGTPSYSVFVNDDNKMCGS